MAWVIDTCLLIDVLDDDPRFGESSARMIDAHIADGLEISPVSAIEMAPTFLGEWKQLDIFLSALGVQVGNWDTEDTRNAFLAWDRHIRAKRSGHHPRKPVADMMIGAFALKFQGILTRNPKDFKVLFPELAIKSR
jgi:hypothetical protein